MRVGLDGELIRQLVKERGGVGAFLDHWSSLGSKADDHPDSSTLYRWMSGERLPKTSEVFLRLAGLLDVDPFGLVAISAADILAAAEDVLRIVQNATAAPPWLQFVHGFFGRQKIWPPDRIASVYFGRPWHFQEFSHDPSVRSNCYARLLLDDLLAPSDRRPQVLHFAFKHPFLFHARWLQYGLVRVQGGTAVLHHINGHTDRLDMEVLGGPIAVESWFGPGPALFRVASLHPFTLRMTQGDPGTAKVLRFPG